MYTCTHTYIKREVSISAAICICVCLCSEFPSQSVSYWRHSPLGPSSLATDSVQPPLPMQKDMRHLPQGLPESLCYLLAVNLNAESQGHIALHTMDSQTFLTPIAPWQGESCVTLRPRRTSLSLRIQCVLGSSFSGVPNAQKPLSEKHLSGYHRGRGSQFPTEA